MTHPRASSVQRRHPDAQDVRRWQAVVSRDERWSCDFVYAVHTTGIFCRCSCASKKPRRENVSFFDTAHEARAAGFRACKRCHPEESAPGIQKAAGIATACRSITADPNPPVLKDLAQAAGMSPHHFHRLFKATVGVTPRSYWMAHRAGTLREQLAQSSSVTAALHEADFGSARQFYALSKEVLGMTPSQFKTGGAALGITFAVGTSSLGHVLVAATGKGLCAVLLGDDPQSLEADLRNRFPNAAIEAADKSFEQMLARVIARIDGPSSAADLPLDIQGTAFQRRVWEALRTIPSGMTQSYTDIAKKIGAPAGVRAVAGACAANPLAILVPCHRVVRSDGALSGYRWGIERKRALLERERAEAPTRTKPGPRRPRG